MKILLIFRFFHYIEFINIENLCFILILKEKMTRVLTFNIVRVRNFEIGAAPNSYKILKARGRLLEEIR